MSAKINHNTQIIGAKTTAVKKAVDNLKRDLKKAFWDSEKQSSSICLVENRQEPEAFDIIVNNTCLEIQASDDLGFIYGIYEISRSLLGIHDFWFWNDQVIVQKEEVTVAREFHVQSRPNRVKYRGWFVNDEVLISAWSVDRIKEKPWEMVFEALLRCGGNMVIPGTDKNSKLYADLASDMGLIVTHHHAEPLGADMFARAYPELNPSYPEHEDKFQLLWKKAIEKQKSQKIIWNLGFRGQGDCPFWKHDPDFKTDRDRGGLMSRLIKLQYDMVKEAIPDAVCSTNLYGETMELYQKGFLEVPEDVIMIWADNGYGKMVSRRQGNHNPRVYSLPEGKKEGRHGIYYHVSFYDLQAANHITMLPNSPEFVKSELQNALKAGADDYWIVNCSNIKPHIYYLDLVACLWKDGESDIVKHREDYVCAYYQTKQAERIVECFKQYPEYTLAYGTHEDEHAGEQFSNHVARTLISQYMKDATKPSEELLWAIDADTLAGQIKWYRKLSCKAADGYKNYLRECEQTAALLEGNSESLFRDSILLQVQIHYHCFNGAYLACEGITESLKGEYQKAFYYAGKARAEYTSANDAMRGREHGKWHNFYYNECLTDVKQTEWLLKGFMAYVRNLGDGPHFFRWQREFLYSDEDRRVMLILNMENHMEDADLFALMEEKWDK